MERMSSAIASRLVTNRVGVFRVNETVDGWVNMTCVADEREGSGADASSFGPLDSFGGFEVWMEVRRRWRGSAGAAILIEAAGFSSLLNV